MRLKDKVALVTGAGKGIGRATALLLAEEGASVIVNYRSSKKEALDVVDEIAEIGARAIAIQSDVAKLEEVDGMIEQTLREFERIDILVNNAGVLLPKPFDAVTDEIWNATINSNTRGVFNCIQVVSRQMKKQGEGKIINISSISGIVGSLTSAPYSVSKAGVDALTKTLAAELGKFNITINSIAPGPVTTELFLSNYSQELIDKLIKETPLGRLATPEDIARTVLFFASEDSDFINGQTLIVDGGRIIR